MATAFETIPGVGRPARDALLAAGYTHLETLDGVSHASLRRLHGMGDRSLERLQAALAERGMGLVDAPPPQERRPTFSAGHTGSTAPDIKTVPTAQSVAEYVDSLDARRREHGRLLLGLFGRATGEQPVMWGDNMVGYGQVHYRYATGREGDTFRLGFSPRKGKISLYGLPHQARFLERLGKHTTGVSCLYVNKPEDVDLAVLEEMIRYAWGSEPTSWA